MKRAGRQPAVSRPFFSVFGSDKFAERIEGTFDLCGIRAVGDAEIAGKGETVTGNENKIVTECLEREEVGIRFRTFGHHVEGAAGTDDFKAQIGQGIVEEVHVGFIDADIGGEIAGFGNGELHQRGWTVVPDAPGNLSAHLNQHF